MEHIKCEHFFIRVRSREERSLTCIVCMVSTCDQVKGNVSREVAGGDRARRMLGLDCQLMGLTWLLAKNKTVYIPTVSAVLRAMLYTAHPTESGGHSKISGGSGSAPPRCSPDQENMPLAVDSLQFEHAGSTSSAAVLLRGSLLFLALYCFVWDAFL